MTQDNLKFTITQLRMDKIIYALESIAVSFGLLIIGTSIYVFFPPSLQNEQTNTMIQAATTLIALGYLVFALVGNFKRYQKIKELESELK